MHACHLREQRQEDRQGEVVHGVHGLQVTHGKEDGGPSCSQGPVHLPLL